jgi:hypothetical protein
MAHFPYCRRFSGRVWTQVSGPGENSVAFASLPTVESHQGRAVHHALHGDHEGARGGGMGGGQEQENADAERDEGVADTR